MMGVIEIPEAKHTRFTTIDTVDSDFGNSDIVSEDSIEIANRFAHDTVDDLMEHLVVDDGAFDFDSHNRPAKRVKQSAMVEILDMLKHIDKDGRRISYSKDFLEHVASVNKYQ